MAPRNLTIADAAWLATHSVVRHGGNAALVRASANCLRVSKYFGDWSSGEKRALVRATAFCKTGKGLRSPI